MVQFITFRLFDSLPRAVAEALAKLPDNLAKTDERLDGGPGACWLGQPAVAELVENAILHFDGERYRVLSWCIMPNHVHVVIEPVDGDRLSDIVHSWKSYSANRANSILGRTGPFWHEAFFDRFMKAISRGRSTMSKAIL